MGYYNILPISIFISIVPEYFERQQRYIPSVQLPCLVTTRKPKSSVVEDIMSMSNLYIDMFSNTIPQHVVVHENDLSVWIYHVTISMSNQLHLIQFFVG